MFDLRLAPPSKPSNPSLDKQHSEHQATYMCTLCAPAQSASMSLLKASEAPQVNPNPNINICQNAIKNKLPSTSDSKIFQAIAMKLAN